METLKTTAEIIAFIAFWIVGLYLWGAVKNRR